MPKSVRKCLKKWEKVNKRVDEFKDFVQIKRNDVFHSWFFNIKKCPYNTLFDSIKAFSLFREITANSLNVDGQYKHVFGVRR